MRRNAVNMARYLNTVPCEEERSYFRTNRIVGMRRTIGYSLYTAATARLNAERSRRLWVRNHIDAIEKRVGRESNIPQTAEISIK